MSQSPSKHAVPGFPWVTVYTILLCALLFPFQAILPLQSSFVSEAFRQNYWNIPLAEFTFVSYMFQHHGLSHLLVNLLIFFGLAPLLEAAIGSERMLYFILVTGVAAGLVHYLADPFLMIPLVGLSGVVLGLLVLMAFASPQSKLAPVPLSAFHIRVWHFAAVIIALQLWGFLSGPGIGGGDRTGYWVHLGGALSGFALWAFWLRKPIERFKQCELGSLLFD